MLKDGHRIVDTPTETCIVHNATNGVKKILTPATLKRWAKSGDVIKDAAGHWILREDALGLPA